MTKNNIYYPGTTDRIIESKSLWYSKQSKRVELELSDSLGYEDFPLFAEELCKVINATPIKLIDGPYSRFWEIRVGNNISLLIIYNDFPNRGYITSDDGINDDFVIDLFKTLPGDIKYDYRQDAKTYRDRDAHH